MVNKEDGEEIIVIYSQDKTYISDNAEAAKATIVDLYGEKRKLRVYGVE